MSYPLTIITITKNNPEQLARTVNSVKPLCKKYGIKQIVVDTSELTTKKTNRTFCRQYHWVGYTSGSWSGISKSYNYGISLVSDGWIWLLNASDYLNPEFNLSQFFKNIVTCTNNVVIFSAKGLQSGILWQYPSKIRQLIPIDWIPQPAVIIKKEIFNKVGKFDEKLEICLDTDYWIRLLTINKTPYCAYDLAIVECDEEGISNTRLSTVGREMLNILILRYPVITLKYFFASPLVTFELIVRYLKLLLK